MKVLVPLLIGVTALASVVSTDVEAAYCTFTPKIVQSYSETITETIETEQYVRQTANIKVIRGSLLGYQANNKLFTILGKTMTRSGCVAEYQVGVNVDFTVVLSNERSNACFKQVKSHEYKHVADDREAAQRALTPYITKITNFMRWKNVNQYTQAQYEKIIDDQIVKYQNSYYSDVSNLELKAQNALHNDRADIARNSTLCGR